MEFEQAVERLVVMHSARWPQGSRFLRGLPRLLPVLREAEGAVEIHELLVDGRPVASMLLMSAGNRMAYYQSGRDVGHDVRGAGSVLMARVIADCHARGYAEFDFLRGAEPYKSDWTDCQRQLVRLYSARGVAPRVAVAGLVALERVKPTLRQVRTTSRRVTRRA
jgi:CelD/BcsL family acetyltransferase involved in cellulose biosynthesis